MTSHIGRKGDGPLDLVSCRTSGTLGRKVSLEWWDRSMAAMVSE